MKEHVLGHIRIVDSIGLRLPMGLMTSEDAAGRAMFHMGQDISVDRDQALALFNILGTWLMTPAENLCPVCNRCLDCQTGSACCMFHDPNDRCADVTHRNRGDPPAG